MVTSTYSYILLPEACNFFVPNSRDGEIDSTLCFRLYISFKDEDAANVGYKGTTFHEIFGGKWKEDDDANSGSAALC
jgi:hypothetical protein